MSGASERMSAAERASEASSAEQANEWAVLVNERTSERLSEWPITDVLIARGRESL